jgi:uroporphyrinogen decarboxylase
MGQLDCEVLGLDWTVNLATRAALVGGTGGPGKALQGNIDPNVLFANPNRSAKWRRCWRASAPPQAPAGDPDQVGPTHIFNLGHGISQHTPPENVEVLVDAVHALARGACAGEYESV